MDFSHNSVNEIFFVDGAESTLTRSQKETLSSAAAHLIECFLGGPIMAIQLVFRLLFASSNKLETIIVLS